MDHAPTTDPSRRLNFRGLLSHQFHLLNRLTERKVEEEMIRHLGLRLLECRIVGIVGSTGPLSLTRLCAHGYFDAGQASRLVGSLVKRGLLQSRSDPSDSRSVLIDLTVEGQTVYSRIYEIAAAFNDRWLADFSEAQRQGLSECVDRLRRAAEQDLGPGPAPSDAPRGNSATMPLIRQAVQVDEGAALALYESLGAALRQAGKLPAPSCSRRRSSP